MAHVDSQAPRRRGPTLTQQIFIGLALGIVAGWLVSEYNPAAAIYFRPFSQLFLRLIKMIIAPLIFATLVAGIAGAGHVKVVGRMGLRAIIYFEIVTTLALIIGLVAVNVMKPGRRRQPADGAGVGDHGQAADLGSDPAPRGAGIGDSGDGRRRRPPDRRLQHPVRDCARHDRREGAAGHRLVRGCRRDDVQVDEHRHALRADRRRRGDRVYGRARRAGGAGQPGVARGHALHRPGSLRPDCPAAGRPHLQGADPEVHQGGEGAGDHRVLHHVERSGAAAGDGGGRAAGRAAQDRRLRVAARLQLQPRRHDALPLAGGGVCRAGGRRRALHRSADHHAADADADEQGRRRRSARLARHPGGDAGELRPAARGRDAHPRGRRADGHGPHHGQRRRQLPGDGGRRQVGRRVQGGERRRRSSWPPRAAKSDRKD